MRTSFDKGIGSTYGDRWFCLYIGSGAGYMRPWWVRRNAGPGNATTAWRDAHPGERVTCGHRGLQHCNSAHCTRWWCNAAHRLPGLKFLLHGHTFRIWCGARSGRSWRRFKALLRHRSNHSWLVSFR